MNLKTGQNKFKRGLKSNGTKNKAFFRLHEVKRTFYNIFLSQSFFPP